MTNEPRGEVIPIPFGIAYWFQKASGISSTWGAIQKLRRDIRTAETETMEYAQAHLDRLAQHISASIRLTPGILDYALKLSDIDENGDVVVILLENDYTEEQLNADVDHLHYKVTITGAPYYIIHAGNKIVVTDREVYYRSIEPQGLILDFENMSPVSAVTTKTTKLTIERFGCTIETTSLYVSMLDIVRRFRMEMTNAIQDGRTHRVEEVR